MDHPNIAKVLDAGTTEAGRPYFVMEYVAGVAINNFADENRLTIEDRLLLFLEVCDAITHAHQKAIIHRDIKASNVLGFMRDGKPHVKVIDFGIAKAALTSDRLTDMTFNTAKGMAIGTYESMSPEQAAGSPDVDTRSDVYSLGALLYLLLSGVSPFDREMLAQKTQSEMREIICDVEPLNPSVRLRGLGQAAARLTPSSDNPMRIPWLDSSVVNWNGFPSRRCARSENADIPPRRIWQRTSRTIFWGRPLDYGGKRRAGYTTSGSYCCRTWVW